MIVKISPKLSEARDLAQTYRQTVPHEALQQQSFYHQINMDVISISVHAEQQFQLSLLRPRESGEVAKYSNERISVCLSVCPSASPEPRMRSLPKLLCMLPVAVAELGRLRNCR